MNEPMPKDTGASYGKDQVVKIINSVISKVEHSGDATIFNELSELQKIIEDARKEIGMAAPSDIKDKHIPTATDELDAVVGATEEATGTIMDCCDAIMEKASAAGGDNGDAITAEVMKVYEACSFQDITGQRITKVVSTLKAIDEKVDKLLSILGEKVPGVGSGGGDAAASTDDKDSLLNGPQMPDKAISQDDIDKLLEEFD